MREPYYKSNAPLLPDPERAASYVSRRQCGDGTLRAVCKCDDGEVRAFVMIDGRWVREQI